jgi:hypothetical protein
LFPAGIPFVKTGKIRIFLFPDRREGKNKKEELLLLLFPNIN